jgi:hypothetical protein
MYVWSKRLVLGLLAALVLWEVVFLFVSGVGEDSQVRIRTIQWLVVNYVLLGIWTFVWMYDQARVRGKNVWYWLVPFIIFPLPSLVIFILMMQRRIA